MKKHTALTPDIISGLFILLFFYAASSKLLDYQKFRIQLGKSPLLAPFATWMSWIVPALEIGIAIALCFKSSQIKALYAAFSMMVVFTAYIVVILNFSEYIPCSCGGILENMSWRQHLVFNILFTLLGVAGVLSYPIEKRSIAIEGEAENLV